MILYFFRTSESELKYTRICERISHLYGHIIRIKTKLIDLRREKHSLVCSIRLSVYF